MGSRCLLYLTEAQVLHLDFGEACKKLWAQNLNLVLGSILRQMSSWKELYKFWGICFELELSSLTEVGEKWL